MNDANTTTPEANKNREGKPSPEKHRGVLIAGDWVIDEYWFLLEHQSEKSTHAGLSHYRISFDTGDIFADLCAAGHTARVLYRIQEGLGLNESNKNRSPYDICGLGNWNAKDTENIKHLFHSNSTVRKCNPVTLPFRLNSERCGNAPPNLYLETLQEGSPTIRVIRQYHRRGNDLVQISRVDWEPQQDSTSNTDETTIVTIISKLKRKCNIADVIIYDSGKGAVNEQLIQCLINEFPDVSVKWYILSKSLEPAWLNLLCGKDKRPELILIRPELAATIKPWDSWLIDGKMTDRAAEIIGKYSTKEVPPKYIAKHIVLLSEQREVVACLNDGKDCITAKALTKPNLLHQLGWSSAFMASLVHIIATSKAPNYKLGHKAIQAAIQSADEFSYIIPPKSRGKEKTTEKALTTISKRSNWRGEIRDWEKAKEGCGVLGTRDNLHLDVWRGATELPGYIAIVEQKRDAIVDIGLRLRAFKNQSLRGRSLSIMLQGDPGSGKTSLAKSLATAFGFSYIGYNITQMIHREELLDLFETVATRQTSGGDALLVFVDEINAFIGNSSVYGAFLSPLEEGVYVRNGKAFSLKPCIWIFAGTRIKDKGQLDTQKLSDFESRITLKKLLDYRSIHEEVKNNRKKREKLDAQARVEQVYIGATAIRNNFPDVQRVSKGTLEYFQSQKPSDAPTRSILKFVSSLKNVQYGEITEDNWNNDTKKDKTDMVSLNFDASSSK